MDWVIADWSVFVISLNHPHTPHQELRTRILLPWDYFGYSIILKSVLVYLFIHIMTP